MSINNPKFYKDKRTDSRSDMFHQQGTIYTSLCEALSQINVNTSKLEHFNPADAEKHRDRLAELIYELQLRTERMENAIEKRDTDVAIALYELQTGTKWDEHSHRHGEHVKTKDEEIAILKRENERLEYDLLDALDLKEGKGPTALSSVVADRDRIKEIAHYLVGVLKGIAEPSPVGLLEMKNIARKVITGIEI